MGPLRAIPALVVLAWFIVQAEALGVRRRLTSVSYRSLSFASPNFTIYHRQDDLLREVDTIVKANPGFMKMDVFKETSGEYSAEVKVVTVEPGGFTQRQNEKVRMLLDFGEHGRELITSELGLLLLRTLADPAALETVFAGDPARGRELQRLLRGTVLKILPLENEGGRRLVESGRLCERKNGRGVDPNRNWPVDWGKKEPDYDPAEEYPGTEPFSEPEAKIVRALATEFAPVVWLNIHSGMEAMLAPWDHKAEVASEAQPAVDLLRTIHRDVLANTSCVVGSGGKSVGYLAHGTATDYMFQVLRVPIASTWEIYGDFQAHFDDCFRMFNPLDEAGTRAVLQRWLQAIMRLVELLPTHPALQGSQAWAEQQQSQQQPTQTQGGSGGNSNSNNNGGSGSTASPPPPPAGAASGTSTTQGGGGAGDKGGGSPIVTVSGVFGGNTASPEVRASPPPPPPPAQRSQPPPPPSKAADTGAAGGAGQLRGGGQPAATSQGQGQGTSQTSGTAKQQREQPVQVQKGQAQEEQQQQQGQVGASEESPRLTVVTSQQPWGSGLSSEVVSGFLAVVGLAVVGILAFRCLARTGGGADRRRRDGYQSV